MRFSERRTKFCLTFDSTRALLPADRVMVGFVLLVKPGLQRREVIGQCGGIHLLLARQRLQRFGPRLALPHRQHSAQLFSRCFVSIDGTSVQWAGVSSLATKGALELELQNTRQEVTHVRRVRWNVVLGAGIKIRFAALSGRDDTLIFTPQFPPYFVVVFRLHFAGKHFPAPLSPALAAVDSRYLPTPAAPSRSGQSV